LGPIPNEVLKHQSPFNPKAGINGKIFAKNGRIKFLLSFGIMPKKCPPIFPEIPYQTFGSNNQSGKFKELIIFGRFFCQCLLSLFKE